MHDLHYFALQKVIPQNLVILRDFYIHVKNSNCESKSFCTERSGFRSNSISFCDVG